MSAEILPSFQEDYSSSTARSSERRKVIGLIHSGAFFHNPKRFQASLSLSVYPEMLTPYTIEELAQMKLFQLQGYNIGFALKRTEDEFNEIVAVHNNSQIPNIGIPLLQAAVRAGGVYLNHFGTQKLNDLYESVGFVEIHREEYNPEFDPEELFAKRYGKLPVIYRKFQV